MTTSDQIPEISAIDAEQTRQNLVALADSDMSAEQKQVVLEYMLPAGCLLEGVEGHIRGAATADEKAIMKTFDSLPLPLIPSGHTYRVEQVGIREDEGKNIPWVIVHKTTPGQEHCTYMADLIGKEHLSLRTWQYVTS